MKKILVIGSISIDNVVYTNKIPEPGTTEIGEAFLSNVGGKGANQACAATFLNADVEFFGSVGDDDNGQRVNKFLTEQKLHFKLKKSALSTGIASITIDNKTAENRIVIVPGANMDITKEDIDKLDLSKKDILLIQLENPIDTVCYALQKAKENGLITVLNPAPAHKFDENYYQYIDFFIPNEHEVEIFSDDVDGTYEERALSLVKKGIKNVIITLGEKGSLMANKEGIHLVKPHKVNAIDTTGAGDSYCGAFVTALSQDKSILDAMEFASKVSSITVTRKGAISSLPHLSEIK